MAWHMLRRMRKLDKVASSSSLSDAEIKVDEASLTNKKNSHNRVDVSVTEDESSCPNKPLVTFSDVHVRRYRLIVGDNPYCEVPLALDWDHGESQVISVDSYDEQHEKLTYVFAQDMEPLNREEREARLRRVGYSNERIRQEERRRRVVLLLEWTFRRNREEAEPFTAPNGAEMFKRYIM